VRACELATAPCCMRACAILCSCAACLPAHHAAQTLYVRAYLSMRDSVMLLVTACNCGMDACWMCAGLHAIWVRARHTGSHAYRALDLTGTIVLDIHTLTEHAGGFAEPLRPHCTFRALGCTNTSQQSTALRFQVSRSGVSFPISQTCHHQASRASDT
jgi:hypothetical protein